MEQTYFVRTEVPGAGHILVPVTVSDEPWKGDLSVTGPEAVTPRRIMDAARRKIGLPLFIGETDRLLLRELSEEDLPAVRNLKLQETDTELLGTSAGQLCDAGFLRSYIRNQYPLFGFGLWGVFLKKDGEDLAGGSGKNDVQLIGLAGFGMPEEEAGQEERQKERQEERQEETPELGYYIAPSFRRKGYAEEACRICLLYAKEELGLEEVLLRIRAGNKASLMLGRKLVQEEKHLEGPGAVPGPEPASLRLVIL